MIPIQIQIALAKHIMNKYSHAVSGWEFANQDEDTITGDFLGNLRCDWTPIGQYNFRFIYNKIRGRGKGALEKKTGADGIITIEFYDGSKIQYKSFVFQAKKKGNKINQSQIKKMNGLFPNGNIIFEYSSGNYIAIDKTGAEIGIDKLLIDYFFACKFGTYNTHYDSKENIFISKDRPISIPNIEHELLVQIG